MIESIEVINQRLLDYFGKFEGTDHPNYRLVWSEDQFEKRLCDFTEYGIELSIPEVREIRKYSYIHNKYVLEKACQVPAGNRELTTKVSHEPIWTFEDKFGNALTPTWAAIEILIYTIHSSLHKKKIEKEDEIMLPTKEATEERIRIIENELFGNETKVGDSLMRDEAVGYGTRKRNDSKFN